MSLHCTFLNVVTVSKIFPFKNRKKPRQADLYNKLNQFPSPSPFLLLVLLLPRKIISSQNIYIFAAHTMIKRKSDSELTIKPLMVSYDRIWSSCLCLGP